MHVFFESVWKLHIGEIPEKPEHDILKLNTWVAQRNYDLAIAAIKQNALTIQNPELIPVFPKPHINGFIIPKNFKPGEFYFWPGGYETKEIQDIVNWNYPISTITGISVLTRKTVAILTLPEEKKNTMENTAEKLTKLFEKHNREFRFDPQVSHRWIVNAFDEYTKTASGSVAAPKEEVTLGVGDGSGQHFVSGSYDTIKLLQGKLIELESYRLSYTFEEDGETGLSLLDRLTPPGDTDISRGRDEIQLLTEEIELLYSKELTSLRQQLKEREEALKELLPIAEQYRTKIDNPNWEDDFNKSKAIIERARKLISK